MPNQRKQGLKGLTTYTEAETIQAFKRVAQSKGTDMATMLREFVEKQVAIVDKNRRNKLDD